MCSIPGLPTPGSEVPVLIMGVNLNPSCNLVELLVNMDGDKKHIYEQMREDIQIPKMKFDESEGKPEDLCLVCISDTWHRARIVSIQNETYNIFLIDQGKPHITTSAALAWGQCDSFLLPPEIESCILANVLSLDNNWPERATNFLKSLSTKRFKGLVQHVLMPDRIILLDIPIVSKHMFKCGVAKKIPGDEFKCLVQKCLHLHKGDYSEAHRITQEQNLNVSCQLERHNQYFYPELLTDTFETVNVTEVTDPQNIFCELQIFSKAVKILSDQMHQHYEESSDSGEARPQTCGDPCAAKGLKGRWHRSLLKQNMTRDGAVEVFHVDEGKTESVPVEDVRPLHGKFLRMPVVTYHCSLDGVKHKGTDWTTDQIDFLKSLLLHRTVAVKFDHHNISQDVYHVTLYAENAECVNSCFIEKKDSNAPRKPITSFLHSLEDERSMDAQNKVNLEGVLEEPVANPKNLAVNGRADGVPTSSANDINGKEGSEQSEVQSNGHLEGGSPSEVPNAHDHGFTVGSSVNVKVTCIESQKFWCQTTENVNSLKVLMQELQKHYAFAHPQPLVESICVARNPNNKMWYRARIIASHHSPVVDVRFIDYGQTGKVPLRDVRPIDPAFLLLNAQAFQCCLCDLDNPTNPAAITWTDSALTEFEKFVDSSALSNVGLKCSVKAVTSDEEGLPLNVVDVETPSDSASKLLAQVCAQAQMQIPPQVAPETYCFSTYDIEVGGKEKVWITSSENINNFYCQLNRNSDLFAKVRKNVQQHIQPQWKDHPFGIGTICLARYTGNHWYRGQIVEISPKLTVHFVDYGDTIVVSDSDICPFPSEASTARSIPVQAVPLGLFNVPEEVPPEVNQWFSSHAVGASFTISVVAKEAKGKLIVELFEGSLNVNVIVQEKISQMIKPKMTGPVQPTEHQLSNSLKYTSAPNEDFTQEIINIPVLTEMTEQSELHSSNGMCARDELRMDSQSVSNFSAPEMEQGQTFDEGKKQTLDVIVEEKETVLTETFNQGGHSDSEVTESSLCSCPEENLKTSMNKRSNISQMKKEMYASSITGPQYFWCQYSNTDELNMVSRLAQEAGQGQPDMLFSKTLKPGSPCLALFSTDNQWYRALVIRKNENILSVLFVDYGNESDVDMENVRPLPQCLLKKDHQAFLCSLNGFDESRGSWDDEVYDDFYNSLVDKLLTVTILDEEDNAEMMIPQHAVQIECENMVVNDAMMKHWKPAAKKMTQTSPEENLIKAGQAESNKKHLSCSTKKTTVSPKKVAAYASCIVEPHFFWCQYANTEELDNVLRHAQEAGQEQQDIPKPLTPGSLCLALFLSDKKWYRAQVMHMVDNIFHVLFIDYGNEADVGIENMRPLPKSLLDTAPQAFLCCLKGYDKSRGSWIDEVYDDFYNLLVDKPLELTVFNVRDHSESAIPQYSVEVECEGVVVNAAMQKYWKPVAKERVSIQSPQTEPLPQGGQTDSNMPELGASKGNANAGVYKKPNISKNKTEMVYASCIAEPHFFWCQYANTEELNHVSRLAQEAGQAEQDVVFASALAPGSPCLALFSSHDQWYRAQVIHKVDNAFHVVFMDYGNESEVDIKNVRPLPQSLLDKAPLAFLCSLSGFDKSKGSWEDEAYNDFYNLLIDKPLTLMMRNMEDCSEIAVPQYAVHIDCEGVVVNTLMEKYWKRLDADRALEDSVISAMQPD